MSDGSSPAGVRTATAADAAGLAPLITHLGYPSTPEQMRARLERIAAACEAWARGQGAASVHLTTALHREGAHRFYERLGYERTGARYLKKLG